MTTSDKITHAMDVLFLIGIAILIFFFAKADREHEKEMSRLAGTIQQLEGKVVALEAAVKPGGTRQEPGAAAPAAQESAPAVQPER